MAAAATGDSAALPTEILLSWGHVRLGHDVPRTAENLSKSTLAITGTRNVCGSAPGMIGSFIPIGRDQGLPVEFFPPDERLNAESALHDAAAHRFELPLTEVDSGSVGRAAIVATWTYAAYPSEAAARGAADAAHSRLAFLGEGNMPQTVMGAMKMALLEEAVLWLKYRYPPVPSSPNRRNPP